MGRFFIAGIYMCCCLYVLLLLLLLFTCVGVVVFYMCCWCFSQIQRNTTPMYRAPEMIDLYSNHPINEKADVWVSLSV